MRNSKKLLVMFTMLASTLGANIAQSSLWSDVDQNQQSDAISGSLQSSDIDSRDSRDGTDIRDSLERYRSLNANTSDIEELLDLAPDRGSFHEGIVFEIPLPDSTFARFRIFRDDVMAPELAQKFPEIKTYWGYEISNPKNSGRFDTGPNGFHGMIRYDNQRIFIEPLADASTSRDNYKQTPEKKTNYLSYRRQDSRALKSRKDKVLRRLQQSSIRDRQRAQRPAQPDGNIRTYRLAVSTSGEFTGYFGGSKSQGLAAVVTTINRVNEIYEVDLAIRLELVANNDRLIFTNKNSDPFRNNSDDIDRNTAAINRAIGRNAYDIGHVFVLDGGGVAEFESVCDRDYKGAGLTGDTRPTGDPFYVDYVAHEIGHQFGAEHTFNGGTRACEGNNRAASAAYEPGSGSTVMSYAGICGNQNLQSNSDAYFHTHSISEISNFVKNRRGRNCGTNVNTSNRPPLADAGANYTIPARAPFTLTGSATDPDGADRSRLTYVWEQYDRGSRSNRPSQMVDNGNRPLFRSFPPSRNKSRTFPLLRDVINGSTTFGMAQHTRNRTLNFRLTVRDQRGGVSIDDMKVRVVQTSDEFKVTSPRRNANVSGSTVLRWNVANTDSSPINCSRVDVSFSRNDGSSFTALASNIANDGSATISLPNIDTNSARIKVSCRGNIFFAMSPKFKVARGGSGSTSSSSSSSSSSNSSASNSSSSSSNSSSSNSSSSSSSNSSSSGGAGTCLRYVSGRQELSFSNADCLDFANNLSGKTLQVWDSDSNPSCDWKGSISSVNGSGTLNVTKKYVSSSALTGTRLKFTTTNNCKFVKVRVF